MKNILLFCILIVLNINVQADTLSETNYTLAQGKIGKGNPVFLEFGAKACPSCKIMGETLYKISENNPEYDINYINIYENENVINKYKIVAIPMQVIYDEHGKEVYKNVGLVKEDTLNELFKTYKF